MTGCAKGVDGYDFQGMDGSINGAEDGGDDDGGGTGGDTNGANTGIPMCTPGAGTCATPNPVTWMPGADGISQTATISGDTTTQCPVLAAAACLSAGAEAVYALQMPIDGKLSIAVQAGPTPPASSWSAAIYVTSGTCGDLAAPSVCQSLPAGAAWTPLQIDALTLGQPLFLYVDGADIDAKGPYTLTLTASPP